MAFSPDDHARIAAAITAAEASTSGEIFAVFAHRSDGYFFVSSFFALALSLAAGLVTALLAKVKGANLPALSLEIAEGGTAVLLLAALALSPALRMLFVPPRVRREAARRLAHIQFAAHNLSNTTGRTGVLLFVSEAERHAEVVADTGIAAKVPQAEWDGVVNRLTEAARNNRLGEGFTEAIGHAGRLLAEHFPAEGGNPNELPDRLVEL